jgi:hypothetical protein
VHARIALHVVQTSSCHGMHLLRRTGACEVPAIVLRSLLKHTTTGTWHCRRVHMRVALADVSEVADWVTNTAPNLHAAVLLLAVAAVHARLREGLHAAGAACPSYCSGNTEAFNVRCCMHTYYGAPHPF